MSTDLVAVVCERLMVIDGLDTLTFEEFYRRDFLRLVPMLAAWCGSMAAAEDLARA